MAAQNQKLLRSLAALSRTHPAACSAPDASAAGGERPRQWFFAAAAGGAGAAALLLSGGGLACSSVRDTRPETNPDRIDRLARWRRRSWRLEVGSSPLFHLKTVNPLLEKHLEAFGAGLQDSEQAPSVFVPMCGKSVDMAYLCEQGYRVVGVEGVERPILEFRNEQRMRLKDFRNRIVMSLNNGQWQQGVTFDPSPEFQGPRQNCVFTRRSEGVGYFTDSPSVWHGRIKTAGQRQVPLNVLHADVFNVTPDLIKASTCENRGTFDMMYDRGALDSVAPEERKEYVATTTELLRKGGRLLLIVLDYDQAAVPIDPSGRKWSPPPYSITEAEVRKLYPASKWDIQVLGKQAEDHGLIVNNPHFHNVKVAEATYLLTKRESSSGSRMALFTGLAAALGLAGAIGAGCGR